MEPDVRTRQQYWGNFEPKEAEAGNTDVMPASAPLDRKPDKGAKTVIPKVGSALEAFLKGAEVPPDVDETGIKGEQPPKNPQAKQLNPRVDVAGKEPPRQLVIKKAERYALPRMGRYPLDSYTEVEKAAAYFEKWGSQLAPELRREYCRNLAARADELGIEVSPEVEKYGSVTFAPPEDIEIALAGRRGVIQDELHTALLEKISEERVRMDPDLFAEVLGEFDKTAGIDHLYDSDILDPFYSTFGKLAAEDDTSYVMGNEIVTNNQLKHLAKTNCSQMKSMYGEDVVKEFKKDPVGIFKSLPVDQKKILSRMANDTNFV